MVKKNQLPEVSVDCDQYSQLLRGQAEQRAIAGIRPQLARLNHVVALRAKPICDQGSRATIDQKAHYAGSCSESSLSCEMAACAYAKQARRSSGSRSG